MKLSNEHILILASSGLLITVGITAGFSFLFLLVLAGYCFWFWHRRQELAEREWKADIAMKERQAAFCAVPSKHGILSYNSGRVEFWTRMQAPISGPAMEKIPGPEPEPEVLNPETLFDVLKSRDRILIIGGMGSGKSELLKWLCRSRAVQGELMILDSHAAPDTWPDGNVIGLGRDYTAIEEAVRDVCTLMDERYRERAAGIRKVFPQFCMVIDEMSVLNQFTDLSAELKSLLCECRKVNIKLIAAGQSDRAGAMGLKGSYDLMGGFEAVCYLEKDGTGKRFGKVFFGKSKEAEIYPHPGIFPEYPQTGTSPRHGRKNGPETPQKGFSAGRDPVLHLPFGTGQKPVVIESEPLTRVFESHDEKMIVEMYRDGHSMNNIARAVWGSSNGRRTAQIRGILENCGYSFD